MKLIITSYKYNNAIVNISFEKKNAQKLVYQKIFNKDEILIRQAYEQEHGANWFKVKNKPGAKSQTYVMESKDNAIFFRFPRRKIDDHFTREL